MAMKRNSLVAAVAMACAAMAPAHASDIADAAMYGNATLLRSLLEQGTDVNEPQADGATALHWAAYAGDVENARALIAAGASVEARNREGVTPLALATMSGNSALIEALLDAGADVNATLPNGETPLMMAARTGQPEPLALLLARGAQIDAVESLRGTTALMWAAAYSNPQAVRVLLENGADYAMSSATTQRGRRPYLAPTARSRIANYFEGVGQAGTSVAVDLDGDGKADVGDDGSQRAISEEEFNRRLEVESQRFIAGGEEGRVVSAEANTPVLERSADDEEDFSARPRNATDWGGLTALVFAAREGDIESARLLIAAGADVNQTTEYGWTPLLAATQNRNYGLGELLLQNGADPNIQNRGGWSPLYIATDNRNIEGGDYPTRRPDLDHLDFIKLLLAHGADVNVRMESSTETRTIFTHQWLYEEGATPFLRAAQSSDTELMHLLLEHGADPNLATYTGVTPLMVAAGIGWVEGVTFEWSEEQNLATIQLLLELGADVNVHEREDGRTALMGAAHKGRVDVIKMLVDHGADLAARDIGSRDSIHLLLGTTWQAIDYADGLVRVGVQSAVEHREASSLLRELMVAQGLEVPALGRTLDSICVTEICK
jgi:ankyrin repeat protein